MPAEAFEAGMQLMDDELTALRACIESKTIGAAPAQIVDALYEGFRRRDLPAILGLLSPDVEIVQSDKLPWGGCYRGHERARRFFGQLGSHIDSTVEIDRMIDSGDHVAVTGWTNGVANATGAAYRVPIVHLWHSRDGRIARAQFFIDHPKMLKALGSERHDYEHCN
jgi:uncharacterized protein